MNKSEVINYKNGKYKISIAYYLNFLEYHVIISKENEIIYDFCYYRLCEAELQYHMIKAKPDIFLSESAIQDGTADFEMPFHVDLRELTKENLILIIDNLLDRLEIAGDSRRLWLVKEIIRKSGNLND